MLTAGVWRDLTVMHWMLQGHMEILALAKHLFVIDA